ncbi:ribonuclease T2 family protein [Methylomonas sp. MgM2]
MQHKVHCQLFFSIVLMAAAAICDAAPATGTIVASQPCEAYVSKNKRTNPDGARLVVDRSYSIFEANKADNPDWYRVRIDQAQPAERWVAKSCGVVDVHIGGDAGSGPTNGGNTGGSCSTAGQQDSYVLALSWQPAFCETHRNKPECKIDDGKSYQARNFTLHGLWPNKAACGIGYGFCGEVKGKRNDFCDYPELSLSSETKTGLAQVMPSVSAGSCLQRHEWYKHGTCQTNWSLDEYYDTAVELVRQFNESGIAYFISRNVGNTVNESDFISKFDCVHGADAHNSIELICQGGNLVDVYISLPQSINPNAPLGDLMRQAEGQYKSNCGGRFTVDPIGFSN